MEKQTAMGHLFVGPGLVAALTLVAGSSVAQEACSDGKPRYFGYCRNDVTTAAKEEVITGFIESSQLVAPGQSYSTSDLVQRQLRPSPNSTHLSNPILNGSFNTFSPAPPDSPDGAVTRFVLLRGGVAEGVLLTLNCSSQRTALCEMKYDEWHGLVTRISQAVDEKELTLGGGSGGPGAGPGKLTQSIVYDSPWRLYVDRFDPANGPGPKGVTLVIAKTSQ